MFELETNEGAGGGCCGSWWIPTVSDLLVTNFLILFFVFTASWLMAYG